jgi:hypothetical protein
MNKNNLVRAIVSGTATLGILSVTMAAMARPPYVAVLKKSYPKDSINCQSCHDGAPPKLAAYGSAIQTQLKAKKTKDLTPAIIAAAEKASKLKPSKGKAE